MTISSFSGQYAFLSNFYKDCVFVNGVCFKSVEHYFQSLKTTNQIDFQKVREAATPALAKRIARKLPKIKDWEQVKENVMLVGLRAKFSEAPLNRYLLETGEEELIEGNTWGDTYWGVCKGIGQNRLGFLLMQVRKELQDARRT